MRGCRQGRPVASLFVCRPPSLGGRYPEKVNSPRELSVDADTSGSRLADPPHRKGRSRSSGPKGSPPLAPESSPIPRLVTQRRSRASSSLNSSMPGSWAPHCPSPTFLSIREFLEERRRASGQSTHARPTPPTRARSEARGPGDPDVGRSDRPSAESPCKLGKEAPHPPPHPPRKPWTIIIVGSPCPP